MEPTGASERIFLSLKYSYSYRRFALWDRNIKQKSDMQWGKEVFARRKELKKRKFSMDLRGKDQWKC